MKRQEGFWTQDSAEADLVVAAGHPENGVLPHRYDSILAGRALTTPCAAGKAVLMASSSPPRPQLAVFRADTKSELYQGLLEHSENSLKYEGYLGFIARNGTRAPQHKGTHVAVLLADEDLELGVNLKLTARFLEIAPEGRDGFDFHKLGIYYGVAENPSKVGFLFPGQGSQYVDMGKGWLSLPPARSAWERAALLEFQGENIPDKVFAPPGADAVHRSEMEKAMASSQWTHPCIATVSRSLLDLLRAVRLVPNALSGHSWGDITALHAGGVLGFEDMLSIARERGALAAFHPSTRDSGVLIVQAEPKRVDAVLKANRLEAWICNYNTPNQVVVSSWNKNLQRLSDLLASEKIDSKFLPISAAPHCPIMNEISRLLGKTLESYRFGLSRFPIYGTLFGRVIPNQGEFYKKILTTQMLKPVRFVSQIENMYRDGIRTFVEVGPDHVLSRFVSAILGDRPHEAIFLDRRRWDPLRTFLSAMARLIRLGHVHDLSALWDSDESVPPPVERVAPADITPIETDAKRLREVARAENVLRAG